MYRPPHIDLCTSASPPVLRGHRVTVASHECGKDWIDKVQGARFVSLGKSPLAGDARRAKFKQVCSVRWGDGVGVSMEGSGSSGGVGCCPCCRRESEK